jgi:hypothetical protein
MTTTQPDVDILSGRFIPIHMLYDTCRVLKAAGVVLGKLVEDNNLFGYMTMPDGWRVIRVRECTFWMVDSGGHRRAEIFYNPNDHPHANVFSVPRFTAGQDWDRHNNRNEVVWNVYDDGQVVFTSSVYPRILCSEAEEAAGFNTDNPSANAAKKECTEWLDARFPQWANHSAYWY